MKNIKTSRITCISSWKTKFHKGQTEVCLIPGLLYGLYVMWSFLKKSFHLMKQTFLTCIKDNTTCMNTQRHVKIKCDISDQLKNTKENKNIDTIRVGKGRILKIVKQLFQDYRLKNDFYEWLFYSKRIKGWGVRIQKGSVWMKIGWQLI